VKIGRLDYNRARMRASTDAASRPARSPRRPRWGERGPGVGLVFLCVWLCLWSTLAFAGPPDAEGGETGGEAASAGKEGGQAGGETAKAQGEGEGSAEAERARLEQQAASVRERARRVSALVEGKLDPEVDPSELFTISLVDPAFGGGAAEVAQLQDLLRSIYTTRVAKEAQAQAEAERRRVAVANKSKRPKKREPLPEIAVELPPEPELAPADADPLTRARSELARAYWEFLTLPAQRRSELLAEHGERRAKIAARREAEREARARLERLNQQAEQLAALIEGELDPSVDPGPLLRVDLSAPDELTAEPRLARVLGSKGEPSETQEQGPGQGEPGEDLGWTPPPELAAALAEAEAALDAQRLRFLALTPAQRTAMLERHAERQRAANEEASAAEMIEADEEIVAQVEEELTEAEDKAAAARREREQAEAAAAAARSAALRRMAEERARLLGVKEAHANYEVELAKRKKDILAAHEIALRWDHDVRELAERRAGTEREQAADAMYGDLRAALSDARDRLRKTLDTIARGESGVEPVGEPLAGLPQEIDRSDLASLRSEVEASEKNLRELEREVVWGAAERGRDDIVMLNHARLTLLDLASDDLRQRMTGFGVHGVQQVRREIDQIALEVRYRFLALPRLLRGLVNQLEDSALPVIFSLLKLIFLILLFRYWRKRAEPTLERWRDAMLARERGHPRFNAGVALALWYLERIRRPLEWLLLFALIFRMALANHELLELEVVWLVVLWLLLGSTVILFVDAVAAHESMVYGRGSNRTAQLRIRSLRLVGLTIVLTGLVLGLTEEIVGRGAIHKWVRSLVWIAAFPILLVLIRWWREHAFRRIQNDPEIPDNALVRWIRNHTEGAASFAAAAVAGGYLFVRGLARWLLRHATSLESTRRLLAWMFRREVARQASARREDERPVRALDPEDYEKFDPAAVPEIDELSESMAAIGRELLDEIIELKVAHRGTLSAVIGERGAGKSTFLRRLARELEARAEDYEHEEREGTETPESERHEEYGRLTVRRIQCPPGGFRQLQRAIAESLDLDRNTPPDQIAAALSQRTPLVFLIDDAHRLVRPAIGGLEGLDRFADFAREVSGDASWIASIGAAAWQYVSRARGERVFFDQVLNLPRWDEQQIGELIRERSAAARIRPSFDEIVIPRQFDVATVGELDETALRPTEEQRAELGYYRILWDYAKGNPAVALHFWRESLWVASSAGGEERIKVRLFKEPPAAALDEVGPTLHFVLRGVVQLEIASPSDLVACTQLPPADVADALRFALARGWIDRVGSYGERYCVTWHWYRAITDMLRRQHLLAI
jgi:hypothetical protein